jgi:hypothetical protein
MLLQLQPRSLLLRNANCLHRHQRRSQWIKPAVYAYPALPAEEGVSACFSARVLLLCPHKVDANAHGMAAATPTCDMDMCMPQLHILNPASLIPYCYISNAASNTQLQLHLQVWHPGCLQRPILVAQPPVELHGWLVGGVAVQPGSRAAPGCSKGLRLCHEALRYATAAQLRRDCHVADVCDACREQQVQGWRIACMNRRMSSGGTLYIVNNMEGCGCHVADVCDACRKREVQGWRAAWMDRPSAQAAHHTQATAWSCGCHVADARDACREGQCQQCLVAASSDDIVLVLKGTTNQTPQTQRQLPGPRAACINKDAGCKLSWHTTPNHT